MNNAIRAAALVFVSLVSGVAIAQPVIYSPAVSAAEAQDIAASNGVVALRKLELDDGKWKIEGRDVSGARVEMKIDPISGAIVKLERHY
jgi:hypothetical protein